MKNLINKLKAFFADEQGAETVEWVMVAAVLTAIIIAVFNTSLRNALTGAMSNITTNIGNAR
jgi:pilus assembly protein Flp/PilA